MLAKKKAGRAAAIAAKAAGGDEGSNANAEGEVDKEATLIILAQKGAIIKAAKKKVREERAAANKAALN